MPTTNKPITFDGNVHREMTDDEYAQWLIDNQIAKAQDEAAIAKAAARNAVLQKLGLSADEAAALFG
jgi:hypothetical protein